MPKVAVLLRWVQVATHRHTSESKINMHSLQDLLVKDDEVDN